MFSGTCSLGEVCEPAWSSLRTACAPTVTLRLISAKCTFMASTLTRGSTTAAPGPALARPIRQRSLPALATDAASGHCTAASRPSLQRPSTLKQCTQSRSVCRSVSGEPFGSTPQHSAASSRGCPSITHAIASIRRAALAPHVRPASHRKSPTETSYRVIATAMFAPVPNQEAERITDTAQMGSRPSQLSGRLVLHPSKREAVQADKCAPGRGRVQAATATTPANLTQESDLPPALNIPSQAGHCRAPCIIQKGRILNHAGQLDLPPVHARRQPQILTLL